MGRLVLNLRYACGLVTNLIVEAFKLVLETLDVLEIVALLVLVLLSLVKLAVLFFNGSE